MANNTFVPPPIPADYYARLGPRAFPGCRDEDIEAAFRDKVKTLHPDRSDWDSKAWYEAVVEARDALETQELRDAYDGKVVEDSLDEIEVEEDEEAKPSDVYGGAASQAEEPYKPWVTSAVRTGVTVAANPSLVMSFFEEPLEADDKALAVLGGAAATAIGIVMLIYIHGTITFLHGLSRTAYVMLHWSLPVWIVVACLIGGLAYAIVHSPFAAVLEYSKKAAHVTGALSLRLFAIYLKLTYWLLRYIVLKIMAQGASTSPGP
jgi:hypothetical protein